jgi:hypothetical protein
MEKAAELAEACSVFYSRGRAVAWFSQACAAAGMRAAALLGDFSAFLRGRRNLEFLKPPVIESLQVEFLSGLLESRGKGRLLPALTDLVRLNGAWARALYEGAGSELSLSYDPDSILGAASVNLPRFVAAFPFSPTAVRLSPGPDGPVLTRRKAGFSPAPESRRTPGPKKRS